MTPTELAMLCKRAIEDGSGSISLELPRKAGGSDKVRLCGRNSPLGELLCENSDHRAVARFYALDVLAWLHVGGVVKVTAVAKGGS
jgi:hypothetical protein